MKVQNMKITGGSLLQVLMVDKEATYVFINRLLDKDEINLIKE